MPVDRPNQLPPSTTSSDAIDDDAVGPGRQYQRRPAANSDFHPDPIPRSSTNENPGNDDVDYEGDNEGVCRDIPSCSFLLTACRIQTASRIEMSKVERIKR